jgi:deoxyadenosine/deoxycytidine kinase
MSSPIIVTIEGNIGAGKSRIISEMKNKYKHRKDIVFVQEPVDIWNGVKDESGTPILELFYQNQHKYAFAFQQMAYITRFSLLKKTVEENPQCKIIICERSLAADRNIFAQMLFDNGIIDKVSFDIYKLMYNEFTDRFQVNRCVYIDADPEICISRIAKRARSGESEISLEYLEKCKSYHDNWLLEHNDIPNFLHLNTNADAGYVDNDDTDCGNKWISQIMEFIEPTTM